MTNSNYFIQENVSYACTSWAPVVGFAGIAAAVVFASKFVDGTTPVCCRCHIDDHDDVVFTQTSFLCLILCSIFDTAQT